MPCPVELKGPIQQNFPDGPGLVFKLVPEDYAYQHDCRVLIYINDVEVTGTGDFGGAHVSARTYNSIVIQPVPKYIRTVRFKINCPNPQCESDLWESWGEPPKQDIGPGFVPMLALKLLLIFFGFPLVGWAMAVTFIWFGLWAPLMYLNELLKKSPNPSAILKEMFGGAWEAFREVLKLMWKGLTAPF